MKFKIACGSDDEQTFTNHHFGDSKYFLVYEYDIENLSFRFIKKIKNTSGEKEEHGNIKKAKKISSILENIKVFMAFTIGPNISVMRKKFVPIISREKNIIKALSKIKKKALDIFKETQLKNKKDKRIFIID